MYVHPDVRLTEINKHPPPPTDPGTTKKVYMCKKCFNRLRIHSCDQDPDHQKNLYVRKMLRSSTHTFFCDRDSDHKKSLYVQNMPKSSTHTFCLIRILITKKVYMCKKCFNRLRIHFFCDQDPDHKVYMCKKCLNRPPGTLAYETHDYINHQRLINLG